MEKGEKPATTPRTSTLHGVLQDEMGTTMMMAQEDGISRKVATEAAHPVRALLGTIAALSGLAIRSIRAIRARRGLHPQLSSATYVAFFLDATRAAHSAMTLRIRQFFRWTFP